MTERTWNVLGAAALGVGVVFGLMPILPDAARIAALVAALGLAVAAFVVRRRVRSSVDREGLAAHGGLSLDDDRGEGFGSTQYERRPDQRHIGLGGGGGPLG